MSGYIKAFPMMGLSLNDFFLHLSHNTSQRLINEQDRLARLAELPPTGTAMSPSIAFPAGNDDFRAARNRCSDAVRRFNSTADTTSSVERAKLWKE